MPSTCAITNHTTKFQDKLLSTLQSWVALASILIVDKIRKKREVLTLSKAAKRVRAFNPSRC